MTNKKVFSVVLVTVAIAICIFYLLPKPIEKKTASMQFHPDSVIGFELMSPKGQFIFNRKNRNELWKDGEGKTQDGIQEILNALTTSETVSGKSVSGNIKIRMSFSEKQSWEGEFDGKTFTWKTGLLKDQSIPESKILVGLLSQGKYLVQKKIYNWCRGRPKKLEFKLDGHATAIEKSGLTWKANAQFKVDPTQIEKWLSLNCEIKVNSFYDIELFGKPSSSTEDSFAVTFDDNSFLKIERRGLIWIPEKEDFGFSSLGWEAGLQQLGRMTNSL